MMEVYMNKWLPARQYYHLYGNMPHTTHILLAMGQEIGLFYAREAPELLDNVSHIMFVTTPMPEEGK